MDYKLFNRQQQQETAVNVHTKVLGNPQNKAFQGTNLPKPNELPNNKIHSEDIFMNPEDGGSPEEGLYVDDLNQYGQYNDDPVYEDGVDYYRAGGRYFAGEQQEEEGQYYDRQYYQQDAYNQQFPYEEGWNQMGNDYYNSQPHFGYFDQYNPDQLDYGNQGQQFYDQYQQPLAPLDNDYYLYADQSHPPHGHQKFTEPIPPLQTPHGRVAQETVPVVAGKAARPRTKGVIGKGLPEELHKGDPVITADPLNPLPHSASKNLLKEISAFSKSDRSIPVKKPKNMSKQKDDQLSNVSIEIESSKKGGAATEEKKLVKTKSHDDLKASVVSGLKLDYSALKKSTTNKAESKSNSKTIEKLPSNRGPDSSTKKLQEPAFDSVAHQRTAHNKQKQSNAAIGGKVDSKRQKKDEETKLQKPATAADKKKKAATNREDLINTVVSLINSQRISMQDVTLIKKTEEDDTQADYVRIQVPVEQSYNDHFISYKPNVLPSHPPNNNQKKTDGFKQTRNYDGNYTDSRNYEAYKFQQSTATDNYHQDAEGPMPSLVEQAMHKTLTGKLQRHIKKLSDDEKVSVFKQLKAHLPDLLLDQYGRYVIVLLLKTNIICIVDALIAYFQKLFTELITNKSGHLFCQSLLELKFKDVRLRRILKRIDQGLGTLIANENAAQIILIYVTLLPPNEMADFVSYCQEEAKVCLDNGSICKIFAKVYGKVSDVERLAIEIQLKNIMPHVFDGGYGRDLVEIFVMKADIQNMQPLCKMIYEDLSRYIASEDFEYYFSKVADAKRTEIVEDTIHKLFLSNSVDEQSIISLLNHEVANKNILNFWTLASLQTKNKMGAKLTALKSSKGSGFNSLGNKLLSMSNDYFSSVSVPAATR